MISIRPVTLADYSAIRAVELCAFGRPEEADLVEALRTEGAVSLELLAEANGAVAGHVLFSELPIVGAGRTVRGAALAPLAVDPTWQRRGIGSALVHMGLPMLSHAGVDAVVVLGDPDYYARFGFSAELASGLASPFPGPHFLAMEIAQGCLDGFTGCVRYAGAFRL